MKPFPFFHCFSLYLSWYSFICFLMLCFLRHGDSGGVDADHHRCPRAPPWDWVHKCSWPTGCWEPPFLSQLPTPAGSWGQGGQDRHFHSHGLAAPIHCRWQRPRVLLLSHWDRLGSCVGAPSLSPCLPLLSCLPNIPWHCHPGKREAGWGPDFQKVRKKAKNPGWRGMG